MGRLQKERDALVARNALLEAVLAAADELLQATGLDAATATGLIGRIGPALRADRVLIGRILPPDERSRLGYITFEHEWTAPKVARQTDDPALRTFDLVHYEKEYGIVRRGEPVAALTEEFAAQAAQVEQEATGAQSQFQYPIMVDGELWGTLGVDDCHARRIWNMDEVATLRLAATALGSLVKRERLMQARVAAERELAEERARMAREIHDTLAQGFTGVIMQLHAAEDAFESSDAPAALRHVTLALDRARMGLAEARRSVYTLRPPLMDTGNLGEALRIYVARVLAGGPVRCEVRLEGDAGRLDAATAVELFRIAQEALGNAMRHARARRIDVHLAVDAHGGAVLEVADDGCGMDPDSSAAEAGGFGLISMRERAARLRARFELASRPGAGTRIRVDCLQTDPPPEAPDPRAVLPLLAADR